MPRFRPLPASARAGLGIGLTLTLILSAGAAEPEPKDKAPANRLARETSPYLLLHAHNPVDWYPWGPEALAKAKAENRPIFLSVGYSSCYWCHVMERESFMNPAIAKYLNEHFVSVKVDREERPDIDQIYMTALRAFGNGAGWPMSMFLTPDGRPFFGGTYFPPEDRDGFEGFLGVLKRVDDAWRDHRAELDKDADRLVTVVRRSLAGAGARGRVPLSRNLAAQGRVQLAEQFDPDVRRLRLQPREPPPSQVPRAGQPRLPPRSAPPRRQGAARVGPRPPRDGRHDARPDGSWGHPRPARRRVSPLRDEPVLERPPLREDALRQRAARRGPFARLRAHRRRPLAARGRGHVRVPRADHDRSRRGLLLGPRRRGGRRGGSVVRLDPRRGCARARSGRRPRRLRRGLRPDARAQLRRGPLRPPRAPQPRRTGRGARDHARGARSSGSRRSAPSSWPCATVVPRRSATTRS